MITLFVIFRMCLFHFRSLVLCLCGVLISGCASNGAHPISVEKASHDFEEAVAMVQKNYVDEVNVEAMVNDAVASMHLFAGVAPLSNAVTEEPLRRFSRTYEYLLDHPAHPLLKESRQDEHPVATDRVDVGVLLVRSGEWIRIAAVTAGSAAETAGLNRGDAIIAIDGQTTAGMSLSWCYQRLSGEAGTVVEVTVNTEEGEVVDYRVVRIPVHTPYVVMLPVHRRSPAHSIPCCGNVPPHV